MFGVAYSLVSYLGFLLIYAYFACFSAGVLVPKHVDSGSGSEPALALAINLVLLALFGLQHSVMARAGFKRWFTRFVPASLERASYVLGSNLALALLLWQWRALPTQLWHVTHPALAASLWAISILGWVGVPVSSLLIDHFALFGIKQALAGFRRRTLASRGFVTPYFYRYVRHPMMSALLLALWVTPHMTVGHLLLAAGMSAYIVIGVHYEERSLIAELGPSYLRYRETTPKFLPGRPARNAETSEVSSTAT